jgi:hypothetical protein
MKTPHGETRLYSHSMRTILVAAVVALTSSALLALTEDPHVSVTLNVPARADLAVPFPLTIIANNSSPVPAHDVEITVDFRADVGVKSLPEGCSNPAAGRVVCAADTLVELLSGPSRVFAITLFGPPSYGNGLVKFTATVHERERDSNPNKPTPASTTLYVTFYVTTTADSGAGSLRQAIFDVNAATGAPLAIVFRIGEESPTPWKTIRVLSPLPTVTAHDVRIDGVTQAGFFGDTNPAGPEIEISGGGNIDGHGLLLATCGAVVANLAIGGFGANGLSVTAPTAPCAGFVTELHDLFIGTDPTGSFARPNARGIGTSVPNGNSIRDAVGSPTTIHDCVISGNTFSGIFGMSGRLNISNNRIGVKAHADEPLPNGASGVFIGAGGFGSDVGPDAITGRDSPTIGGNVIAFNGETGVAIASGVIDVGVRNNRIWGNRLLGIDIGLDGPTLSSVTDYKDLLTVPVLTLAHFDPAANKTIIEGDIPAPKNGFHDEFGFVVSLFASDAADPSGFGEGQRSIGFTTAVPPVAHFRFEANGDLSGQWITATNAHTSFNIAAKPLGIDQGFLTQTSEFSRGVPVQ